MERTAPARRVARLLAVLAVLLGLLAMHGLASGHHSSAAAADPVASAVADAVTAGPTGQHHGAAASAHLAAHHVAGGPAAAVGLVAAVLPGVGTLGGACTDCPSAKAAALCLAVLSVGLALLARLLARRAQAGGPPAAWAALSPLRRGLLPLPRPPDLVAGLCVSRT